MLVTFIEFLAFSHIQVCFHYLSSPIRSGVMADHNVCAKILAHAGLKGFASDTFILYQFFDKIIDKLPTKTRKLFLWSQIILSKHYVVAFLLFSVNFSGYYIQRNISGFYLFILPSSFFQNNLPSVFHMHFSVSSFFYVFVSLSSVISLWRSKTQKFGSACSWIPCSSHQK